MGNVNSMVVATLKKSGCYSGGGGSSTWIETKVFCETDTIGDVMDWAKERNEFPKSINVILSFDHKSLDDTSRSVIFKFDIPDNEG